MSNRSPITTYQQCLGILWPELSTLRSLNQALRAAMPAAYRKVLSACKHCGTAIDWFYLLSGTKVASRPRDIALAAVQSPGERLFCYCGQELNTAALLKREASDQSSLRRVLFENCRSKLLSVTSEPAERIAVVVRFLFRLAIFSDLSGQDEDAVIEPMQPLLNVVNVYSDAHQAQAQQLKGAQISLNRGELVALTGALAAAKKTLLNIIGCLEKPTQGAVYFDGVDTQKLSEPLRAGFRNRQIGFVYKSMPLVPGFDVCKNVALPLLVRQEVSPRQRLERAEAALAAVGLTGVAHQYDHQLTPAQRLRVLVARAIVGDPSLVLIDSSLSDGDNEAVAAMIALMVKLSKMRQMSFLLASADEATLAAVDRTVQIWDGVSTRP